MAKIAVVDLVFNYPPNGGASTDLYGIFSRLKNEHQIKFFLPNHEKIKISRDFDLDFELIDVTYFSYNCRKYPEKLKSRLDEYAPDHLFIADGWYLKPYIVNYLVEFKPILRFYAYETLCLKSHGHFARLGKVCNKNYLHDPWASLVECKICSFLWILLNHNRVFLQEYLNAKVYSPNYANVVKKALSKAHKIIVYNEFTKSFISKYNKEVLVVPSGVDIDIFKPISPKNSGGKIKILVFGRLEHWYKGLNLLIESCKKLWMKRKDFTLRITTNKQFKEPFIEAVGWIEHSSLPALIHDCDICVIPSIWEEPFGISVLEAMACGKAVIGSDVGGIPEIIEDNKSGLIFRRNIKDELFNKLELLMDNEGVRNQLGEAARRWVVENYSWDIIVNEYYHHLFK